AQVTIEAAGDRPIVVRLTHGRSGHRGTGRDDDVLRLGARLLGAACGDTARIGRVVDQAILVVVDAIGARRAIRSGAHGGFGVVVGIRAARVLRVVDPAVTVVVDHVVALGRLAGPAAGRALARVVGATPE